MIPTLTKAILDQCASPRTRGDDPVVKAMLTGKAIFSPHPRG